MRTLPINLGTAAIVAGVSLIAGSGGGLYWLTVTVLIYFLWSALNAWVLVVEAAETSRGRRRPGPPSSLRMVSCDSVACPVFLEPALLVGELGCDVQ